MDADRQVRWIILGLTLALAPVSAAADPAPADLIQGEWRLETPLGSVAGPCLVLHGTAGSWRCEIAVAEEGVWPTVADVLGRRGRGWTITATADGGFVQPWSEPWRKLGPAAATAFESLLREWTGGRATPESRRPARRWLLRDPARPAAVTLDDWSGLPAAWRPPGEGNAMGGELRRRLTTRGRGRGGEGLVLDLRWEANELVATSARWPGHVTLRSRDAETVTVPAEAYLPLWPLAEFLR